MSGIRPVGVKITKGKKDLECYLMYVTIRRTRDGRLLTSFFLLVKCSHIFVASALISSLIR